MKQDLRIVDEFGFVPLSKTGAEMLFEVFSQRYERSSTLVTSSPFGEWTEVLGSERLTGDLSDRLKVGKRKRASRRPGPRNNDE
jgi:DNA replication protein DnaC